MRRRTLLATIGSIGAAATLAGCSALDGSTAEGSPDGTGDGSAGAIDGQAQVTETEVHRQFIHVSADGEVETDADMAHVSVAVEATGEDAADVRDELAESIEAVREALEAYGLDEDQLSTGRFRIRESRNAVRYEGTHELSIEIYDVDAVGEVVDTAVDAGADSVGRISFTLTEETREDLRDEAIELAVENARAEAETIATAKGLEIVGVQEVTTSRGRVRAHRASTPMVALEADDAAAGTAIDDGPVTVSASVEITYRFEE